MNQERITSDPTVAAGAPIIRGTQVTVREVLDRLARGHTSAEIIAAFPQLTSEDISAALAYAADLARHPPLAGPSDQETELDLNRILIVDDQEMNRLYMQALFRDSEFELSVAASAQEALDKAHAERPFLILSDIQMPQMDGFELCRRIKADPRTQNAAVIFVTAHHRSATKVSEGLDMGADDYIFRPFEHRELLSRVQAVARLKRAEATARQQAQIVARRNQALQLLNELAMVVASSPELGQIFALSMEKLSGMLNAEALAFLLLDREKQEANVHIALSAGQRITATRPFPLAGQEDAWEIQERVPSIVADVLAGSDSTIQLTTISCLPMVSPFQVVGAVAIINRQGGPLTDADWMLLHSAVGIIAVAIENARLLQSVQDQVADLILLNEIGRALTSTLDLSQILERTTQLVQESLQAEAVSLWLLDEASQELVLTALSGPLVPMAVGSRLSLDQGVVGHVARTGKSYFDAGQSSQPSQRLDEAGGFVPGSIICVPVHSKDQTVGVIQALHRSPRQFDQNDLRWLFSVASSVGIAVENGRLFAAMQAFNQQLERMVAERTQQLAAEKDKTEAILASMADGLLVLDAQGTVVTVNAVAEEMLSCCLDDIRGHPPAPDQLATPLWRSIYTLAQSADETATAAVDVPDETQPGGVRSIQAHSARVYDENGTVAGTVIVLRDITALKQVERMKARFMAGITHELKTPLSIIQLHASNLQAYHDRLPAARRQDLLDAIQRQVRLLEQLVEDILTLTRLDAGERRLERQPVNIDLIARQVLTALEPLADRQSITLDYAPPDREAIVQASPRQIERLLRNLVDNAIKFTPSGGRVQVALSAQAGGQVQLQVADTGIGIPPEHQPHVFDRFYRVDTAHTIPGTGLGLAIVKEIVEALGGDVALESAPGRGSTFTVTLPASEEL